MWNLENMTHSDCIKKPAYSVYKFICTELHTETYFLYTPAMHQSKRRSNKAINAWAIVEL